MTPYTPAAIDHIRQHAMHLPAAKIADDLGWDLPTLRERARRHGIDLLAPTPTIGQQERAPVIRRTQELAHHVKKMPPFDASATLDEIIAALTPSRARVIRYLAAAPPRTFIGSKQIALDCGVTPQKVRDIVHDVRPRMKETRYAIRSKTGSRNGGGGFCLEVRE